MSGTKRLSCMILAAAAALTMASCGNAACAVPEGAPETGQVTYINDEDAEYILLGGKEIKIYTLDNVRGSSVKKRVVSFMKELSITGQRLLWGKRYIPRRLYNAVTKTDPER